MSLDDTSRARKETVIRLLTAIAERDRESASRCLSDDATWWVPQSAGKLLGRPIKGRQNVLDLLCGESHYEVGTMKWEPHQVLSDENFVVVHCTLRATTRGGRDYENHYALLYRFDDLLVSESWEYTDTAYAVSRFAG